MAWALIMTLAMPGPAAASDAPETRRPPPPELLAVFALYSAKSHLAASAEAERLLAQAAWLPEDRRFLAELAAAGYRDAYDAAAPDQKDPLHLCRGVAVLTAYLAEPGAQARPAQLRDALAATLVARHPEVICPQTNAPMGSEDIPTTVGVSVIEEVPPLLPVLESSPSLRTRTRRDAGVISGGVLLAVAGVLAVAVLPVQVRRLRARGEADLLHDKVVSAGEATAAHLQRRETLQRIDERTQAATIGLAVSAAALTVVGVALIVSRRGRRPASRVEVTPQAGLHGGGIVLRGEF